MGQYLAGRQFSMVLTSPRHRAIETCRIAGHSSDAIVNDNLAEWDYGDYEACTSAEIRGEQVGWTIWSASNSGGESIEKVAVRAEDHRESREHERETRLVFSRAFS